LGLAYAALSDLDHSEAQLRRVVDELATLAPDDPVRLSAAYELVEVLSEAGKDAEAKNILAQADAVVRPRGPAAPRLRLLASTAHGDYFHGLGRYAEALDNYRVALALQADNPVKDDVQSARLRVYAADCEYLLNRPQAAIDTLKPIFATPDYLSHYGVRYGALAAIAQGRALGALGRLDEADALMTQALQALREHLGPGHQFTLIAANELGNVKVLTGKEAQALGLFQSVYEQTRKQYGADATLAFMAQANVGDLEMSLGHDDAALRDLLTAKEGLTRREGPNFPQIREVKLDLATVYVALGRLSEAQAMIDGIDQSVPHVEGANGPFAARLDALLAQMAMKQGDKQRARDLIQRATAGLRAGQTAPAVLAKYAAIEQRIEASAH
jgi:tetratricopeptide (TPR) repeat protein